jgi:hypothetical protein
MTTVKAWEITISGSYKNDNNEVVNYEGIKGIIPLCPEDQLMFYAQRYEKMWIAADERYPVRYNKRHQTFVDDMKKISHEFSYIGKDISEMTWEELQDLACAKGLNAIPHFQVGSLRSQRETAYREYAAKILREELATPFNLTKASPIYPDANIRVWEGGKADPEAQMQNDFGDHEADEESENVITRAAKSSKRK